MCCSVEGVTHSARAQALLEVTATSVWLHCVVRVGQRSSQTHLEVERQKSGPGTGAALLPRLLWQPVRDRGVPRAQKQRDSNGTEVLSPLDKLFIVHVWREGKHRERERWSTGGPLLRGLDVALANYRHAVVELEVRSCEAGMRAGICVKHTRNEFERRVAAPGAVSLLEPACAAKCFLARCWSVLVCMQSCRTLSVAQWSRSAGCTPAVKRPATPLRL